MATVTIPRRYRGPPESGNGGYSCGVFGTILGGEAEVTLRSPPPLDTEIAIERERDSLRATVGEKVVAEAKRATVTLVPPKAPTLGEATAAAKRFPWMKDHLYPTCFVCGPGRIAGDGLRVFPGAVEGRDVAAAPFVAVDSLADGQGVLRPEVAWALLDCPSWFGFSAFNAFDQKILLGRLAARLDDLPRVGDRCIAYGWSLGRDGRKIRCGSALATEAGTILAVGEATWIVLA